MLVIGLLPPYAISCERVAYLHDNNAEYVVKRVKAIHMVYDESMRTAGGITAELRAGRGLQSFNADGFDDGEAITYLESQCFTSSSRRYSSHSMKW